MPLRPLGRRRFDLTASGHHLWETIAGVKRLRVTQVIPDFAIGGTQKAGCVLAEGLTASGHPATVLGWGGGVRFVETPDHTSRSVHIVAETRSPDEQARAVLETEPQVVHIHGGSYKVPLLRALDRLAKQRPEADRTMVVSTPVFGRPPTDADVLGLTKTCLIGTYMLYRMRRWMGLSAEAMIHRGVGVVTINSFQELDPHPSTLDPAPDRQARRRSYGVKPDTIVFGRLGREIGHKWHPRYPEVIDQALAADERLSWLSIGFPAERGRDALQQRWGDRFVNLPETPELRVLYEALSCMDLQLFFSPWGECFSTTICEAACVGLPTICGVNPLRDNGQTEQIIEGKTGHLAATTRQAVEQLKRLGNDPDRLQQMQRSTYDHAHSRWTTPKVNDLLLEFYEAFSQPDPLATSYAQRVIADDHAFSQVYAPRMVDLLASGPVGRLRWRATLAAVADYRTFRFGRLFKKWL